MHIFIGSVISLIYTDRNLDPLTETYGLAFYTQYLAHWPEYFQVAESPSGEIMGYSKNIQLPTLYTLYFNALCDPPQSWANPRDTATTGTVTSPL